MTEIPEQLRDSKFRFIKVGKQSKIPLEKNWQDAANYSWFDIVGWISSGNNYGIATGFGGLCVIDCDDLELQKAVLQNLPPTMIVKTGSGGTHFYFICDDLDAKIVVQKSKDEHYGEVQFKGQQVVGAGSIHPNGNKYVVFADRAIAKITKSQLMDAIKHLLPKQVQTKQKTFYQHKRSKLDDIRIEDLISTAGFTRRGDELQGSHPMHGSTTGLNFSINTRTNQWHCFRCNSGGGIFSFISMMEGIVDCWECV